MHGRAEITNSPNERREQIEKRKPIFKFSYTHLKKGSPVKIELFEAALFDDSLAKDSHYRTLGLDGRFRLRINGIWFCPELKNQVKLQYAFFNLPEIKELIWRAITNEIES